MENENGLRRAAEVFEDHLWQGPCGTVEENLARNYAPAWSS